MKGDAGHEGSNVAIGLDEVRWIHPSIQARQLEPGAFVLRLSGRRSFEAHVLFLLPGTERAIPADTGRPPDAHAPGHALPLRR